MRKNADKMQHTWENFSSTAKCILADLDYGFFVIAEREGEVAAFAFFTYEWSDWRDGVQYWLQGLEAVKEDMEAFKCIKEFTENYKHKYEMSGIRICAEKTLKAQT